MIKLVVTDLDGSLLDDNKNIHDDFWTIEQQLTQKGILFCAASGRQYYSILEKFESIKERVIFIAENGTFVVHNDKVLHRQGLDKAAARKFVEIARKIDNAYMVYCCEKSAYVESSDQRFWDEINKYYKRIELVDDITRIEDVVLKFSLCDFSGAETNSLRYFQSFEKDYKVAIAGKLFLDITQAGANKGTAVKLLQDRFGVPAEQTLVFGDFPNDLEMLDAAKYNYAMINAHPEVLKKASFITEFDNNNNGVVEIIKKLCLNGHNF